MTISPDSPGEAGDHSRRGRLIRCPPDQDAEPKSPNWHTWRGRRPSVAADSRLAMPRRAEQHAQRRAADHNEMAQICWQMADPNRTMPCHLIRATPCQLARGSDSLAQDMGTGHRRTGTRFSVIYNRLRGPRISGAAPEVGPRWQDRVP